MNQHPSQTFHIRKLREEEWEKWNRFVLQQRDGTIFHTTYWLKHQPNRQLVVYGLFKDDELVGGYPVCVFSKFGFKLASRPIMTPYSGPVVSDAIIREQKVRKVAGIFLQIAKEFDAFRFSPPPQAIEISNELSSNTSTLKKRTNRLQFTADQNLFNTYSSSLRNHIRKARKKSLNVELSHDFDIVYDLSVASYKNSGRDHPFKKKSFMSLITELGEFGLSKSYVVRLPDGTPVAACWIPRDRNFGYNVIHGIDRKHSSLQGGPMVLHKAISDCMEDGLGFDFEGSMQDRINKFYKEFGSRELSYSEISGINHRVLNMLDRLNIKKF